MEAYVDDAILTASAKTFKEAHKILADMMMTSPPTRPTKHYNQTIPNKTQSTWALYWIRTEAGPHN
jgi:hypothetical protein